MFGINGDLQLTQALAMLAATPKVAIKFRTYVQCGCFEAQSRKACLNTLQPHDTGVWIPAAASAAFFYFPSCGTAAFASSERYPPTEFEQLAGTRIPQKLCDV